jgi:DNA-binding LacI/PurR family transcriptional regulator
MADRESDSTRRATLYDVARVAGVSHMTVSRVVRQEKGVRESTRDKVREAIREMGYQPDPALSALAAYRTRGGGRGDGSALAFLDCDGTKFSRDVLAGVRAEAALLGYRVATHRPPLDTAGQRRLSRILFHRGIRGLLFGPSDEEREFAGWDWPEVAAVSLAALTHRPAMHAVAMNYFDGAFSACRILWENGCRRIGFAIDPGLERRTGHQWLGGYAAAMECRDLLIYRGRWPVGAAFRRWAKESRLDGLLAIDGRLIRLIADEAVSVMLLNDADRGAFPALRVLRLNRADIGAEGVRLLHHLLLRREYGLPDRPRMVAVRGTWSF